MTTDEARDEVAKLLGWRLVAESNDIQRTCWINELYNGEPGTGRCIISSGGDDLHPIPTTIDGIAALWPEDWWITVSNCDNTKLPGRWHARGGNNTHFIPWQMGDTEYEARLTLLLAVLEAKGKP